MKAWAAVAVAAAAALVFLLWYDYARDPGDTNWTDPDQPPPMVAPLLGTAGGRMTASNAYRRTYPGSLAGWSDTVIGNC